MTIFSITKFTPEQVRPSEPTACGNLPLSFMDRNPGLRVLIASIFVYRNGDKGVVEVIREALSKVLVYYYPVAGRITESEEGEPEIACTGDGVWFVEASANCSLKDVNYLQLPLMISKEELLPFPPPKVDEKDVILMLQVTQFSCGGFVVGLRSCHSVFDGVGQGQFLKAMGELARGLAKPTVEPIWCREAIPDPPKVPLGPPPTLNIFDFELSTLDITLEHINHIKNRYMEETGQRCSSFDILAAKTWQCRTRAIGIAPHEDVHLGFAVNTRHLLGHLLPQEGVGYYGNCIYNMTISATSEKVACSSLVEVISLIRDAKKRVPTEFFQWMAGKITEPNKLPLGYGTLCVLDWSRVGLLDVDYGWGEPMHGAPVNDNHYIAWCIFLKPLPPKQGVRLIMECVQKEHLTAFHHHMMNMD